MSQQNVEVVRGVRTQLSLPGPRASGRRAAEERLALRFPAAYALLARTWARLPPGFWLRRVMLARSLPRTCAAFNRRDFAAFLLGIDPGIEFRGARDLLGPDQAEVTRGHEDYLEFFQYWINAFDDLRYEPEEVLDLGDKFLVTVQLRGHGQGSGIAVSQRLFTFSHLQRGAVVKQENFLDRSKALEAVGLSE